MTFSAMTSKFSVAACLMLSAWVPVVAQTGSVSTFTVRAEPVGRAFELDGQLEASTLSTVSAQASGRVLRLAVKAGDPVRKGQVLAELDDRILQADVAAATAQLRLASTQLKRTESLVAKGFMSEAALDDIQAQVSQAAAAQSQAQIALGFSRVTASMDAVVLDTQLEAGDLAAAGTPVVTLYQPQRMRAVVHVPASLVDDVRRASSTQVHLGSGQWVVPTQLSILPGADVVSQTVELRLELDAAASTKSVPGEQLQVRFAWGEESRLVVPLQAVVQRGELTAVYVRQSRADRDHYVLQPVRLAQILSGERVVVVAGLKAGDTVALEPVAAAQTSGLK